jgi:hypothetical protein
MCLMICFILSFSFGSKNNSINFFDIILNIEASMRDNFFQTFDMVSMYFKTIEIFKK